MGSILIKQAEQPTLYIEQTDYATYVPDDNGGHKRVIESGWTVSFTSNDFHAFGQQNSNGNRIVHCARCVMIGLYTDEANARFKVVKEMLNRLRTDYYNEAIRAEIFQYLSTFDAAKLSADTVAGMRKSTERSHEDAVLLDEYSIINYVSDWLEFENPKRVIVVKPETPTKPQYNEVLTALGEKLTANPA